MRKRERERERERETRWEGVKVQVCLYITEAFGECVFLFLAVLIGKLDECEEFGRTYTQDQDQILAFRILYTATSTSFSYLFVYYRHLVNCIDRRGMCEREYPCVCF